MRLKEWFKFLNCSMAQNYVQSKNSGFHLDRVVMNYLGCLSWKKNIRYTGCGNESDPFQNFKRQNSTLIAASVRSYNKVLQFGVLPLAIRRFSSHSFNHKNKYCMFCKDFWHSSSCSFNILLSLNSICFLFTFLSIIWQLIHPKTPRERFWCYLNFKWISNVQF